jgi:peptidoglycan/LPS O-acetylase OafA/YrhL
MSAKPTAGAKSSVGEPNRLAGLDGLRGVAALTVVAHHTFECLGTFAASGLQTVFLTLGQQCVWLFFVISGVVLARSALRPEFRASTFLISRVVRLYIPTIAAAMLTYLSMAIVSRKAPTGNPWIDGHPQSISLSAIASDFTLVDSTSGNLMPLWSLKWEVLYSAFLLVFILLARAVKWQMLLGGALILGSAGLGQLPFYASMFLIGTVLGVNFPRIYGYLYSRQGLSSALALIGIALIGSGNFIQGWTHLFYSGNLAIFLSLLGISSLVLSSDTSVTAYFLRSRPIQFLGMISFSLYLVHEPIIIAASRLGRLEPLFIVAGALLSVGVAYIFYKTIEKRAHALSRSFSASGKSLMIGDQLER